MNKSVIKRFKCNSCHKLCIRFLVDQSKHDLRTVLCKNLESIAQDCNVQSRNLKIWYTIIFLLDQEWKLPILHELLKVKDDIFVLNYLVDNEIATMINFL